MQTNKTHEIVDDAEIQNLLAKFNSPLFIVSDKIIREKYQKLKDTLYLSYPNSQIAYSFKTNYLPKICNILKDCGAYAEVASGFEYWLAKKIGFPGNEIIFNGPYKKDDELLNAFHDRCILNVDNYFELNRIEEISKSHSLKPRIGLRVNLNYSRTGSLPWNRFGFNIESGEAMIICSKFKKEFNNFDMAGLQMHLGTNICDTTVYRSAVGKIVDFIVDIKKKLGIKIDYIDVGGGFSVYGNKLKTVAEENIPSVQDYVDAVVHPVLKKLEYKPLLIFEPGRFLVAEAMTLFTKVISKKEINGVSTVTVDSSTGILREASFIDFRISAVNNENNFISPTTVFGSLCAQADILGHANLPRLEIGDILAFHGVGAYSLPRSSQWIFPRPAVVLIKHNGASELIKKAESYEDMVMLDYFS